MKEARLITWRVDPHDSLVVESRVECSTYEEAEQVAAKLNAREYTIVLEKPE